jgi:hypothetical protein
VVAHIFPRRFGVLTFFLTSKRQNANDFYSLHPSDRTAPKVATSSMSTVLSGVIGALSHAASGT